MEFVLSFRPIPRMGTPDDVANAAAYLASDLATFASGQHLLISGGAPALTTEPTQAPTASDPAGVADKS